MALICIPWAVDIMCGIAVACVRPFVERLVWVLKAVHGMLHDSNLQEETSFENRNITRLECRATPLVTSWFSGY